MKFGVNKGEILSIEYQILGRPFLDNALYVKVNTGQTISRLLFDCGQGVLYPLSASEIKKIDYLLFSHYHIDHIAGFDNFLRIKYGQFDRNVKIWGPRDTHRVISNRLQGVTWNLIKNKASVWEVNEVDEQNLEIALYKNTANLSLKYNEKSKQFSNPIVDSDSFTVEAIILDHMIPCLGYLVKEKTRWNINIEALKELNLSQGIWLSELKKQNCDSQKFIAIGDKKYNIDWLKEKLLVAKPGDTIAYLSDFLLDNNTEKRLLEFLPENVILVCESKYCQAESDLAKKNYHLTNVQVSRLAALAKAKKLILFHFSPRYNKNYIKSMLKESRANFQETYIAPQWSWLL